MHQEPMDARLHEVIENTRKAHVRAVQASTPHESTESPSNADKSCKSSSWRFDPLAPSLYYGPSDDRPSLPALEVS